MKLFQFIRDMYIAETGKSSKRFIGSIMILSVILLVYMSYFINKDLDTSTVDLAKTILFGGLCLFGVTSIDKFITYGKDKK